MRNSDYPERPDYDDDLDELLQQVDELVSEPARRPQNDDCSLPEDFTDGFDDDDYDGDGQPILYQNYSNHYGADVKNYANNFGRQDPPAEPEPEQPPQPATPTFRAYNADFASGEHRSRSPRYNHTPAPENRAEPEAPAAPKQTRAAKIPRPRKAMYCRRHPFRCGCGCLTTLLVLVLLIGGGLFWAWNALFQPPVSEVSFGERKENAATVLVCGLGYEQQLTDTMMLIYLDGDAHQVSLLSLPRDSYTLTGSGSGAKLNSAYVRNGSGEEGMEGLLDYVQNIIGYRPDGYMLVHFDLVTQLVDLMGGLEVDVPMSFELEGETLEEGVHHLTGAQVLQLLRFREGYAMQDLGRVEVQRTVVKAAMEQWTKPSHFTDAIEAIRLVNSDSATTLSTPNFLWIAKTLLGGLGNVSTNTLPGVPDYVGGVSYYILDLEEVADLVNESCNPYLTPVRAENLKISGDVQN